MSPCVRRRGRETGNGRVLKKDRWDDNLLFLAQDCCIREQLRTNRAILRLFTMGFVKVRLCSQRLASHVERSSSMGHGLADRRRGGEGEKEVRGG